MACTGHLCQAVLGGGGGTCTFKIAGEVATVFSCAGPGQLFMRMTL